MTARHLGLLLAFFVIVGSVGMTPSARAATGDITTVEIDPKGWVANITLEGFTTGGAYNFGLDGKNNPTNPKIVFAVTSPGFDDQGNATTLTRTIYGTQWLRQAYPNHAKKDETVTDGKLKLKVALSDFVYDGDSTVTVSIASDFYKDSGTGGTNAFNQAVTAFGVNNNSTLAYPETIGRWAWPGYDRVTGDFPVEAVIFNRFPQNGKPVAVVEFTATDQHGNSITQKVREVVISPRPGDANPVQVYRTTIPVASFTQGDSITVNFRALPWVGDAGASLNSAIGADGVAQPSEKLGPLSFLNDKNSTYQMAYALVSPNGSATNAAVYASQAAAEAAGTSKAFVSVGKAAEAIKAYQNSNFGRNSAAGGVILLAEGTYVAATYNLPDLGNMDTWLTLKPASGTNKDNVILTGGTNAFIFAAQKIKVEGLTINNPSNQSTFRGRSASDIIWFHNNTINNTGIVNAYSFKTGYATQNQIIALKQGFNNFATYSAPYALVRGNTAASTVLADMYAVIGNKNITPKFQPGGLTYAAATDNGIYAFNTAYKLTGILAVIGQTSPITHGIAFVENIMEKTTTVEALIQIGGDHSVAAVNNVILWKNTFAGERENLGYNDTGDQPHNRLNWASKFNIFQQWNNKDDTFENTGKPPNGGRTGSWPVGYNVGSSGNLMRTALFRGEFDGLSTVVGSNPEYTNDASYTGSKLGNGDYTLSENSVAKDIQSVVGQFDLLLPYDILGNPITGKPDAGAYEHQGDAPEDTTSPELSALSPTGTLPAGTTSATLSLITNEDATCRYSATALMAFSSMSAFTTTGNLLHSVIVTGLTNGQPYSYYVKCQDESENTSSESAIQFAVDTPPADTEPPVVSGLSPSGELAVNTTSAELAATTNENALCAYGTTSGASFESLTPFTTTGSTTHTQTLSGLLNGQSYDYYVRCLDTTSNVSAEVTIHFSVAAAEAISGLITRLTFDQAHTSGTVTTDTGGGNNNADIFGGATLTTGKFNEALQLDGVNDYAKINALAGTNTTAGSLSFWVKTTDTTRFKGLVAYSSGPIVWMESSLRPRFNSSFGGIDLLPPTGLTSNQWTHVAITWDQTQAILYLNGVEKKKDTSLTLPYSSTQGSKVYIGSERLIANRYLSGTIDDVRLYDRALTSGEVNNLAQE